MLLGGPRWRKAAVRHCGTRNWAFLLLTPLELERPHSAARLHEGAFHPGAGRIWCRRAVGATGSMAARSFMLFDQETAVQFVSVVKRGAAVHQRWFSIHFSTPNLDSN